MTVVEVDVSGLIDYEGRVAVVTGCASGMGRETARLLREAGATVIGLDRVQPEVKLDKFTELDLSDEGSITDAAAQIENVDALFNVAGISSGAGDPVTVVTVNFLGPRLLTETLLPRMKEGSAVAGVASLSGFRYRENVESNTQLVDTPGFSAGVDWCRLHPDLLSGGGYQISKEAVILYTQRQAIAYGLEGIRFNCIGPGATETPFLRDTIAGRGIEAINKIPKPLGRLAQPSEMASALLFLNSDAASYVSAHLLWVDGGFSGGVAVGAVKSDR
jgi:NAD(P)-dependent dehydrogenase (short-subunit alcohol dehydrogenase family)